MTRFQFGTFVFPINPKKISVTFQQNMVVNYYPLGGEKAHSLGGKLRRVVCSGAFFADNPSQPLESLKNLTEEGGSEKSGLLIVPGHSPFMAFLKEYAVDFVDDGCIVPYTLVFLEEGGSDGD